MQDGTGSTTYQATYAYDPVGNRTGQTVNGAATSYNYNSLDQLTSSTAISGTTSYAYNGRGDLASVQAPGGTTTYSWDAADRLAGAALPDGTAASYGYDADGRRVSQAVTPSGGAATTTNYLWDEASAYGDVVAETDGGGNLTAGYTLGAAPCGCGGGGAFTGAVLAQTRGASTSYYLADGQGSTRALTDGGGNVTDTYRYDAYGDLLGRTGTTTNSYLYTGQQFDAQTGLYDLRARYYNPATGLFLSKDSDLIDSRNPGALAAYRYGRASPTNYIDASGRFEYALVIRQEDIPVLFALAGAAVLLTQALINGPYASIPDTGYTVGPGRDFSEAQKNRIYRANRLRNGGQLVDPAKPNGQVKGGTLKSDAPEDPCQDLVPPVKSVKGVTPDPCEAQVDHIFPRSRGGTNSFRNARVTSRTLNRLKSDTPPSSPPDSNSEE